MNKVLTSFLLLILVACKGAYNQEISIDNLKKSFEFKEESEYMRQFPKEMDTFKFYFGWNDSLNMPQELYEESYEYIDYWFSLLDSREYNKYESDILNICENGKWEADAVNYFQDMSLNYFKHKGKYGLINDLEDKNAKSVLFFLFDSPYPHLDDEFYSNLNEAKKKILSELFATSLSDDKSLLKDDRFENYMNNSSYFIRDIDINNDNILDKVVCSEPFDGEELILFISEDEKYHLALKTVNYSQDGGNQVSDIKESKNGFVIVTSFPGAGFFESHYYITYDNNEHWILTNTIFKTNSSNQDDAFTYVCDVKQNIDIGDPELLNKLMSIPEESEREKVCTKVKH